MVPIEIVNKLQQTVHFLCFSYSNHIDDSREVFLCYMGIFNDLLGILALKIHWKIVNCRIIFLYCTQILSCFFNFWFEYFKISIVWLKWMPSDWKAIGYFRKSLCVSQWKQKPNHRMVLIVSMAVSCHRSKILFVCYGEEIF